MNFQRSRSTTRALSATQQRLEALASYHIMDTPAEAEFDQLTQLAASVCEAPIAAISLLDADRQWFKSRVGLEVSETSLDLSFCAHAIKQPREVMIVPDATRDSRFQEHPMVVEAPYLRFYAGAPIVTPNGVALGTLCALDHQPRTLNQAQHDTLQCFAGWIASFLEQRRIAGEYMAAQKHVSRLQSLLPACPCCRAPRNDDAYLDDLDDYFLAMADRMPAAPCPHCEPLEFSSTKLHALSL